jgi:apolipoprotein N-acyltransferase
MLRATNDGVTALIAHDGSVIAALPQFRPAVLTGRVTPREGETPYVRHGNWPVLVLVFLALGAGVVARRRAAQ